jgi:choline dehydrogenase
VETQYPIFGILALTSVSGSGAGGGPLAARLAIAGHKVLLIEAGDDQGSNQNYTVPAFHAKSTEDPLLRWDYWVKHYSNDTQAQRDSKYTYATPDGGTYSGLNPPPGSTPKGILYPRAATIGGCGSHNAMFSIYPHDSDWTNLETITGDTSWSPDNMRTYFERLEKCNYLPNSVVGHGFSGWYQTSRAALTLAVEGANILSCLRSNRLIS